MPFLLHVPGVTDKGMRSDALVELIDIFPTLADVTGLPMPQVCPESKKPVSLKLVRISCLFEKSYDRVC